MILGSLLSISVLGMVELSENFGLDLIAKCLSSWAGFMFLKSLMKGREAVVGVWLAIIREEEKHFLILLLMQAP